MSEDSKDGIVPGAGGLDWRRRKGTECSVPLHSLTADAMTILLMLLPL